MAEPSRRRIFLSPWPWAVLAVLGGAAFLTTHAWYRWVDLLLMIEGAVFFAVFASRRWMS